jgi:hypothetical protein
MHSAFGQQGGVTIDSFKVINASQEYQVEIELFGSNDGSMGPICFGALAKSKDGTVRVDGFDPIVVPIGQQFKIPARVSRPHGPEKKAHTDYLMVIAYQCGKEILLTRKFVWQYDWPEDSTIYMSNGERVEQTGFVAEQLSRLFFQNLQEEDFSALDELLEKWNTPRERDENGEWKLDSFRIALNYPKDNLDWKKDLRKIQKWRELNPKSIGAAIAEAKYWSAYAWNIRGNDNFEAVDPFAMKVFRERMKRAEQILKDSKSFASNNPLWYVAYLDITVATNRNDKFIEKLFAEGIRKHPYFQPLYVDMSKHWSSKPGERADWRKVNEVVKKAVAVTKDIDGISNYALLYAKIDDQQKFEFDLFKNSFAVWGGMKDSYDELVKRYPSATNINAFASYACRAGDKDTYLKLRALMKNHIVPYKWMSNYSLDLCDHRYLQKS